MDNIQPSVAELAYSGFLQNQTSLDDWFSLYVIMIPCVYRWQKIARSLIKTRELRKTPYFTIHGSNSTWVMHLHESSHFLDANRGANTSLTNRDRWNELLHNALKLELELFNSSLLRGVLP
ncbi:hypothetical protein F4777DRAFT_23510 [Nemania sp. FL0916]|nr:hypothetical protein F4777DRAFT_23510 [Nemania sp. FL0916]